MKVFTSFRASDSQKVTQILSSLIDTKSTIEYISHNSSTQEEKEWKDEVETKIANSDKILFLLSASASNSKAIAWEFDLVIKLKKPFRIVSFCKKSKLPKFVDLFQEHIVSPSVSELMSFLLSSEKLITTDALLLEQYKIMIASTEKVTEQRLKVNNLFFTVTSTVLSFSMLLGKELQFDKFALCLMMTLSITSLICTFFWQKLISSYGCLNTGKFKIISEIERQLKTNLFQREWDLLINEVKYRSNTKTETTIIKGYRIFIIIILACEIIYTCLHFFKNQIIWLKEYLHHLL